MSNFPASNSGDPGISISMLDVETGDRRLSEETLLNDKDFSEQAPSSFDFLLGPTSSTQRKFGIFPRLRHIIAKVTLFLLPSFISCYFTPAGASKPEKLAPTAWLDGLRGIACACVVVHHYFYEYHSRLEHPYDGVNHVDVTQLPFIKLIHYGPPMVKIFFIISGFVLTVKAVKITRVPGSSFDGQGLISNLSTSVWKRYLRLYIPCAASFILCAFLISAGWMEAIPTSKRRPGWITGSIERRPPTLDNIFQQLAEAAKDFYIFAVERSLFNILDRPYNTDGHLWTIPVEFKSSIALFVFVTGVCTLKRWLRVYIIIPVFTISLLYYGGWGLALFFFGYFLAELNSDIPTDPKERSSRRSLFKTSLHSTMVIVSLYLLSYPRKIPDPEYTTGYRFLAPLTPPRYPLPHDKRADHTHEFWQTVGAMMLVWALLYLPRVQNVVLCNKVSQYFGKISFAIYIMHGHTQKSIGHWAVVNGLKFVGLWHYNAQKKAWILDKEHNQLYGTVVMVAFLFITFPITVCWADVFWRVADAPSVRFLRWLEGKIRR
ncbi:hypothetical protein TWF718_009204 [Orbilia javanica]|uniref:Acyltransferase 3 domain-containing protein n=1 Tax=Orbilia javanica TaxID=47235 RepID=A0AAN8RGV1_9PEZI